MYKTILVPLDGSERSEAISPHVEALAKGENSRVIFMQVIQPHDVPSGAYKEMYRQAHINQKIDAENYLGKLTTEFDKQNIDCDRCIVSGPVVDTIIAVADRENADIVAIASHGLSGLSRVFYGSTAAGILQKINRPLLLIRSRFFKKIS